MTQIVASSRHSDRFRQLVHRETGIHLAETKAGMVEARLRSRLVALGFSHVNDYFRYIFDEGGVAAELPQIIDLMTTNKTDFFREKAHYDILWRQMIPAALSRAQPGRRVLFKFWSAAASTGAEAWSAAMLLAAAAQRHPQLDWAVLGTDISQRVLETARLAIYPEAELDPVPEALRNRYTMTGRQPQGQPVRRIVPELRRNVRFAEFNLMETPYAVDRGLDAIFLRNVLIYFDAPTQERVVAAMVPHLRPGGHLVVGHSESMIVRQPTLRQVAPAVFERIGDKGAQS